MKTTILTLVLTSLLLFSNAQNLRFSYNVVNNGTTSQVRVSVVNITSTPENLAGFTSNLYYNNAESTISSWDASPSTALGWSIDQGATNHVPNANTAIPTAHSGFGTVNVIDLSINGALVGQTPLLILVINLDNTVGTAAQSPLYLASSSENHPALEYVGNDFVGHPVIVAPASTLPVELLTFRAEALPSRAGYLQWVTENETNNKGFEVERALANGSNPVWETLGFVEGNGTLQTTAEYSFVDQAPYGGENLYRLKQIDMDGSFTFSKIRSLRFEENVPVQVYPNPTANWIRIDLGDVTEQKEVVYHFMDARGALLKTGKLYPGEINRLNLAGLAEGIYILQMLVNEQSIEKRIVKVD